MPKLTKRVVDALEPRATEYLTWDNELKGFGVRVSPKGAKNFLVQYRAGGRTRRIKLGTYGAVTVEHARKLAASARGDVADGNNPAEVRRLERIAPNMAGACDRFAQEHFGKLKPRTREAYTHIFKTFVKPELGTLKVASVTRADISALMHKLRDRPYMANRVLSALSKFFNTCEMWGVRADGSNPCRRVPKNAEVRRERFLSKEELASLWTVLDRCADQGLETPHVVGAFKLLALTGCRRDEIKTLKWAYVTDKYLELPDTKTGSRRVPLNSTARAVLEALPRLPDNPYVILGKEVGQHVTDLERPWRRVRELAGFADVRLHDLRHTFASHAVMEKQPLPMKLLGHKSFLTTMRYAHLADDDVCVASEAVSGQLVPFVPPSPTPAASPAQERPYLKLVKG